MTTKLVTTGRVSSRVSLQSGEKRHELVEADSRLVRGLVRAVRTISVFMMISMECADRCGFVCTAWRLCTRCAVVTDVLWRIVSREPQGSETCQPLGGKTLIASRRVMARHDHGAGRCTRTSQGCCGLLAIVRGTGAVTDRQPCQVLSKQDRCGE
jgi:hypothetical protein